MWTSSSRKQNAGHDDYGSPTLGRNPATPTSVRISPTAITSSISNKAKQVVSSAKMAARSTTSSSGTPEYTVKDLRVLYKDLLDQIGNSTDPSLLDAWTALSGVVDGGGDLTLPPSPPEISQRVSALESRVIEDLRSLSEVVVYGEQNDEVKGGALFDYFCEKNMLSLLVDIARGEGEGAGVARSIAVKAQVVQTVSILVQNVRNETSLYYLLSNNYINVLVSIPLSKFTNAALDELMPVYISFLKTLALRLSSSPTLFQFFVDAETGQTFPLFTAAINAASSDFAKTDRMVRSTALNIVVNVCKIQHDAIRRVIGDSVDEQRILLHALTTRLLDQIRELKQLTVGRTVDAARCDEIAGVSEELQDQLWFINDLLQCGVRPLNVRLCEWLLRRVVFTPLMQGMKQVITIAPQASSESPSEGPNEKSTPKGVDKADRSFPSPILSPSSLKFPGTIVGKRELEAVDASTPTKTQYRIRWRGEAEDGSMDEWFGLEDLMREYPEEILKYEGEVVESKKSKKNSPVDSSVPSNRTRRDSSLAGRRRSSSAAVFANEEHTSATLANVKVCMWTLAQLYLVFEYKPLLRMVAVALLHPLSPADGWQDTSALDGEGNKHEEYVLTPALHGIVQNRCTMDVKANDDLVKVVESPYRKALLNAVAGKSGGSSAFLPASMLLHGILECRAVGSVVLASIKVLPSFKISRGGASGAVYHPLSVNTTSSSNEAKTPPGLPISPPVSRKGSGKGNVKGTGVNVDASPIDIERAITSFLLLPQPSTQSHLLEAAGALCMSYFTRLYLAMGPQAADRWAKYSSNSRIFEAMKKVKMEAAHECLDFMANNVFSHLFIDLCEEQIVNRYSGSGSGLSCSLSRYGSRALQNCAWVLVKRSYDPDESDVEDCRFAIKTFLHFRALVDAVDEASTFNSVEANYVSPTVLKYPDEGMSVSSGGSYGVYSYGSSEIADGWIDGMWKFKEEDICDEKVMAIGELARREVVGTEVELEGRTIFRCFPLRAFESGGEHVEIMDGKPVGEELYLVVDSSQLFLAEPEEGAHGGEVTKVVCNCPMRNIVASAVDGMWIHLSIRHAGEGAGMIKEGIGAYKKEKRKTTDGGMVIVTDAKRRLNPLRESTKVNPLRTLNVALCFDTAETAVIVRGHVEKCRQILRKRAVDGCENLLKDALDGDGATNVVQDTEDE